LGTYVPASRGQDCFQVRYGLHVIAANLSNPKVCKMRWVHGTGENRTGGVGVIVGRVL
jgi:hypothetical protein